MHLCAEEIRFANSITDKFVACVKNALTKAPARRELLLECLEEVGLPTVLPPVPVLTRWCTWLRTVQYHKQQFSGVKVWIEREENSAAIMELKDLLDKSTDVLLVQFENVGNIAEALCKEVIFLETRGVCASDVWDHLNSVSILLESAGFPNNRLKAYLHGRQVATSFWQQVQILDPAKAKTANFTDLPAELRKFSTEKCIPREEISLYKAIAETVTVPIPPQTFWNLKSAAMPVLSAIALKALTIPASTADVERSFSKMQWILRSTRTSLLESNLSIHMRLSYNQAESQLDENDENFVADQD